MRRSKSKGSGSKGRSGSGSSLFRRSISAHSASFRASQEGSRAESSSAAGKSGSRVSPDVVAKYIQAATDGNVEYVMQYKSETEELLKKDDKGYYQLQSGEIKYNPYLNVRNPEDGDTALIRACKNKQLVMVKILLAEGVDLESQNNGNKNALYYARQSGNAEIIDLLQEARRFKELLRQLETSLAAAQHAVSGIVEGKNEIHIRQAQFLLTSRTNRMKRHMETSIFFLREPQGQAKAEGKEEGFNSEEPGEQVEGSVFEAPSSPPSRAHSLADLRH